MSDQWGDCFQTALCSFNDISGFKFLLSMRYAEIFIDQFLKGFFVVRKIFIILYSCHRQNQGQGLKNEPYILWQTQSITLELQPECSINS